MTQIHLQTPLFPAPEVRRKLSTYPITYQRPCNIARQHKKTVIAGLPAIFQKPDTSEESNTARARILEFEAILKDVADQAGGLELPVTHYFAEGLYARECVIEKGAFATGYIHKRSQMTVVISGDLLMFDEFEGLKRRKAGDRFVSAAGIKRAVYALDKTILMSFHGTHEKNLEALKEKLTARSYKEYDLWRYMEDHAAIEPCPYTACPYGGCGQK